MTAAPAPLLAEAYAKGGNTDRERQLKTHLRGPGRVAVQGPDMVRQEIYGYLPPTGPIGLICKAATEAGTTPTGSNKRTVRIVRRRAAPGAPLTSSNAPRQSHGRHTAKRLNPAPAPDLPQGHQRARHNSYRVKRPGDHGTRHPGPATISLVNHRNLTLAA